MPLRRIGTSKDVIAPANPAAVLSGWVQQEEAQKAFGMCRALVFPSLWYHTLGLVVHEAAGPVCQPSFPMVVLLESLWWTV